MFKNHFAPKIIVGLCVIISFILFTPNLISYFNWESNATLKYIVSQIENPLVTHKYTTNFDHEAKLGLRITVPILCKIIFIKNVTTTLFIFYLFKILLCFIVYTDLYKRMRRQNIPIYQTTLLLVNLSLIYFGYSFTYGTLHFDEIAYFFIYYAFVTRLPIIQFFCILFAIFTDERSVISVFLASLIFMNSQKNITIRSIYPIIYLILVIVIREIISVNFEIGPKIQHGGIILFQLIREFRITNITIGFFGTFKLLWIFIIFYFTQLWKQTSRYIAFAILSLTLIYTGASFSVIDTTRTLTYLFPLLLFPIYLNGLPDNIRISNIKVKTQDMLILNILIPTMHVESTVYCIPNFIIKVLSHYLHINPT